MDDKAVIELLSDIENERIDKTKWIPKEDVIPTIRIGRDILKQTGEAGGVQYRGFSNLLDFYYLRRHVTSAQQRAGHRFYRLWHYTVLRDRYVKCSYGDIPGSLSPEDMAIIPYEFLEAKMAINDPYARIAVIDVCCLSLSPGRRKMGLVQKGLDDLVKHFS